jgi:hypothetical protein
MSGQFDVGHEEAPLGMSVGLLCVVLLAMFAIIVNVSVPEI